MNLSTVCSLLRLWDKDFPVDVLGIAGKLGIPIRESEMSNNTILECFMRDDKFVIRYHSKQMLEYCRYCVAYGLIHKCIGSFTWEDISNCVLTRSLLIPKEHLDFIIQNKGVTEMSKLLYIFSVPYEILHIRLTELNWFKE